RCRNEQPQRDAEPPSPPAPAAAGQSSQENRRQLSQLGTLSFGQRDVGCERALLELLDGVAETVAGKVEVGMIDLVRVAGENHLGPLAGTADTGLDLVRGQVLRLIHDDQLLRYGTSPNLAQCSALEESVVL